MEVTAEDIAAATAGLPARDKEDIQFQYERVFNFAKQQVNSIKNFETELYPGVRTPFWARRLPWPDLGRSLPDLRARLWRFSAHPPRTRSR